MRAPLVLVCALLLAGCSAPASPDDGRIHIVASTNVYGDIAAAIGGDLVEVTSIVSDPAQDPHSVDGSVRVQLALSKADIVITNGGGYDDWADTLLAGAGNDDATVINVTEISGYDTTEDFNEHLWYDFPTMQKLAAALQAEIGARADWPLNSTEFADALAELQAREAAMAAAGHETAVAITEPVPLYLLTASGFTNVTPDAFSEAIEEGSDVPPAALRDTLALVTDGTARLLVYNEQTTSPETEQVKAAAIAARVAVVPMTETLPNGYSYLEWMASNLAALEELS